mmetsp:Transcript_35894/g.71435  ORF Transcript_35894/g.71435 Transcript_35894/m.71435 type:complete len:208 (+) Transcript_35894:1103-1726(+)
MLYMLSSCYTRLPPPLLYMHVSALRTLELRHHLPWSLIVGCVRARVRGRVCLGPSVPCNGGAMGDVSCHNTAMANERPWQDLRGVCGCYMYSQSQRIATFARMETQPALSGRWRGGGAHIKRSLKAGGAVCVQSCTLHTPCYSWCAYPSLMSAAACSCCPWVALGPDCCLNSPWRRCAIARDCCGDLLNRWLAVKYCPCGKKRCHRA